MSLQDIPLRCRCGEVQGTALGVNAGVGNRIVCFCDDCQAFARALGRGSAVLDAKSGTDIFQMPVDRLVLTKGIDKVRCLRLTPKGVWRWYADCCKTPIGNTMGPAWPFVGVVHSFMALGASRDAVLGPVRSYFFSRFANGELSVEQRRLSDKTVHLVKLLLKVLIWKLQGHNKPSAFFNSKGQPLAEPWIVQQDK